MPELCKEIEISQQTYYRWRQKYGGMSPDMVKQLLADGLQSLPAAQQPELYGSGGIRNEVS